MTVAQLLVWSGVIPQLLSAGVMVEGQIVGLLKSFHSAMSDADLNAIAALISAGAAKHAAIAKADEGNA